MDVSPDQDSMDLNIPPSTEQDLTTVQKPLFVHKLQNCDCPLCAMPLEEVAITYWDDICETCQEWSQIYPVAGLEFLAKEWHPWCVTNYLTDFIFTDECPLCGIDMPHKETEMLDECWSPAQSSYDGIDEINLGLIGGVNVHEDEMSGYEADNEKSDCETDDSEDSDDVDSGDENSDDEDIHCSFAYINRLRRMA